MTNEYLVQLPADDAGGKRFRTNTTNLGSGDHHMELVILTFGSGNIVDYTMALPVQSRPSAVPGLAVQALTMYDSGSGGTGLTSAMVRIVRVKANNYNSGDIYVGYGTAAGGMRPYSGFGYGLVANEYYDVDTDEAGEVFIFASNSGDQITVAGRQ